MEKTTLEVGDKVRIKNWILDKIVTITKVTKTKAIAEIKRSDGSKYSYSFKRECYDGHVNPFSPINFDTTTRELYNG